MLNINTDVSFPSSAGTSFGRVSLKQIQFQPKFTKTRHGRVHALWVPGSLTLQPALLPQPSVFPEGKFI